MKWIFLQERLLLSPVDPAEGTGIKYITHLEWRLKIVEIRNKCKNHAPWEELDSLMSLGDLIFVNALKKFDPKYLENRKLLKDLIW